jgi:hypothetical protein
LAVCILGGNIAWAEDGSNSNQVTCGEFLTAMDAVDKEPDEKAATDQGIYYALKYFGLTSYATGYWQNYLDNNHIELKSPRPMEAIGAKLLARCRAQPHVRYLDILRSLRNEFAMLVRIE